jgi:hypothetical protein
MSEVKYRVRLDTRQARGDLRGMVRDAKRTAGAVSQRIRSTVGAGLRYTGIGAAIGGGIGAVRSTAQSGIGDVLGETTSQLGFELGESILGNLNEEARAAKSAREETIRTFAFAAGQQGQVPQGAKDFFNSVRRVRLQEEQGRELILGDADFYGPGLPELGSKLAETVGNSLRDGFNMLADTVKRF